MFFFNPQIFFRTWSDDGILLGTLAIYAVLCTFQVFLDGFLVSRMRKNVGIIFAVQFSMQLLVQYEAQRLRSFGVRFKNVDGTFTSPVVAVLMTALQSFWECFSSLILCPITFLVPNQSNLAEWVRSLWSGEKETYGSFVNRIVLPEIDLVKDTSHLSCIGIVASILALLVAISFKTMNNNGK